MDRRELKPAFISLHILSKAGGDFMKEGVDIGGVEGGGLQEIVETVSLRESLSDPSRYLPLVLLVALVSSIHDSGASIRERNSVGFRVR